MAISYLYCWYFPGSVCHDKRGSQERGWFILFSCRQVGVNGIYLCKIFRRIFEVWENVQTLNLEKSSLYLSPMECQATCPLGNSPKATRSRSSDSVVGLQKQNASPNSIPARDCLSSRNLPFLLTRPSLRASASDLSSLSFL